MLNVVEMFRMKFDKMVEGSSMKLTTKRGGINMISKCQRSSDWLTSLFSDVRISDRLDEIDKWRKTLEYTIQDVDREIQAIQSAKEQCERYLEHMRSPLGKATTTLFHREEKFEHISLKMLLWKIMSHVMDVKRSIMWATKLNAN